MIPTYCHRFWKGYVAAIRRFFPRSVKNISIGFDFGRSSLKAVEVRWDPDGPPTLVSWLITKRTGEPDPEQWRRLMASFPDAVSPVTALVGKGTLLRQVELPRMSEEELRTAFRFEAERFFPFAADAMYTDCLILDERPEATHMAVLAAAAKKELVDERCQHLNEAGAKISRITLNAIALANVVRFAQGSSWQGADHAFRDSERTWAFIDIGARVSTVIVMHRGLPWFHRDISIGGDEMTKAVAAATGISLAEAELIKRKPDQPDQLKLILEPLMSNLIAEVRLSFDYFITEHDAAIEGVCLSGGGALTCGLVDQFAEQLALPVILWNPSEGFLKAPGVPEPDLVEGSLLGVALGLACYEDS